MKNFNPRSLTTHYASLVEEIERLEEDNQLLVSRIKNLASTNSRFKNQMKKHINEITQ